MTNLSVAVTAETADLEAKLAIAQANLRDATAQMRGLANEARASGQAASGQLSPGLLAAAGAAAKARVEVAGLKGQLETAGGAASSFRERISLAGKGLDSLRLRIADYTSLASKLGELLAVGFAGERILSGINRTAQMGEALLKLSEATGISTETLSRWHYAAQQLGIDTQTVDTGIVRLAKSMQQALMSPTSAAAQSFNALGLSQEYLRQHSNDLEAVMLKLANAVRASHAGGQQLSAVLNVMGRSAADMVPFLQQGSGALAQFGDEADRLGATISGPQADAMERYEQSVKRVSAAWDGLWIELTTKAAPALTELANELSQLVGLLNKLDAIKPSSDSTFGKLLNLAGKSAKFLPFPLNVAALEAASFTSASPAQRVGSALGGALGAGAGPAPSAGGGIGNLLDNTAYDQIRVQYEKVQAQFASSRDAMLKASVDFWKGELSNTQLDATQKLEVESQYWSAVRALRQREAQESAATAKKDASEQATIERDKTQTAVQLSKIKLQSERETLQAEVDAGQITAAQKLADLRNLADQEYQLDLQSLEDQLATLDATTAAYQKTYDRILILKAQHVAQMRQLDLQGAVDQKKALDQQGKAWQQAGQTITRSFDQVLVGVLRGTQTWQQAMARLLGDLVITWIENIAKLGVEWALGEARRLLATNTANAGIVASNTGAAVASAGAQKASDKETVLEDAKVAAANVYKWVSAIPYVGWALAPEAAAAAFAAVAAFGSFDQGAWQVPTDMVAQIHQGEMIVPAGIAAGIRAGQGVQPGFPGGTGGGSGGDTYVFNIQAVDAAGVANLFRSNGPVLAAALAQQIRLGNSRLNAAVQPA